MTRTEPPAGVSAVRIAITHSDETIHPIHSLVCRSPEIDRELLLYFTVTDGYETVINYIEGDPDVYEDAVERLDAVDYEVYPDGDGNCYSYIRNELDPTNRALATAFQRETLAVIPPLEFLPDRRMLASIVVRSDDFREIRREIPDDVSLEVVSIGSVPRAARSALTSDQRRAIATAWELGYYDIPRNATLQDVADELGYAMSTVSDLLRRGQASLIADELGVSDATR